MPRLLLEMRRRKVLRVAGAYTVAGWVVLQAAEVLMPALALPAWTVTFVAALLLMGLPISMVVAWVSQVPAAPDRTDSASAGAGDQAAAHAAAGPWPWLDLAVLVAVVLVVAAVTLQLASRGTGNTADAAPGVPDGAASVAVLPFTSFTDDKDDNYFADGLTEELINSLAQLAGLKVPGRTSSFYFKNRNEDLRDIGRQLGVGHVVEGSVRRSGEKLRVTVQLVSTGDGFHLWSRTYDRQLTDAFAIQNDIAEQVASALELTLLADTQTLPAQPEAHASYPSFLIATALLRERSLDSVTEARRLFEQILEREPDDVDALSGYARATIILAGAYLTLEFEPAAASAVAAVERALAIDPESLAANLAAGSVYDTLSFRTDERHYLALAERALSRAVALAPNDPDALRLYGRLLMQLGRPEAALEVIERGAVRDPLDRAARLLLAEALRGTGRLGEAREALEHTLTIHPDYLPAHLELGELMMETGALETSLVHLQRAHESRDSPRATFALANVYLNLGLPEAVRQTLSELSYAPLSLPLATMVELIMAGDDAAALAFAEQELARTEDRIWRPLVAIMALNVGDLERAREQLRRLEPSLLAPDPDVSRIPPLTVLLAANLLAREEHPAGAESLLEALLARYAAPRQGFDPIASKLVRGQALAQLGRVDEMLDELAAARLQGYRTLHDFDYFLRLERYPWFADVRTDPRLLALLGAIEAENLAMGARICGSEGSRRPPVSGPAPTAAVGCGVRLSDA